MRKKGIDLIHDPLFNKVYTSPPSEMTIILSTKLLAIKGWDSIFP